MSYLYSCIAVLRILTVRLRPFTKMRIRLRTFRYCEYGSESHPLKDVVGSEFHNTVK